MRTLRGGPPLSRWLSGSRPRSAGLSSILPADGPPPSGTGPGLTLAHRASATRVPAGVFTGSFCRAGVGSAVSRLGAAPSGSQFSGRIQAVTPVWDSASPAVPLLFQS